MSNYLKLPILCLWLYPVCKTVVRLCKICHQRKTFVLVIENICIRFNVICIKRDLMYLQRIKSYLSSTKQQNNELLLLFTVCYRSQYFTNFQCFIVVDVGCCEHRRCPRIVICILLFKTSLN